MRQFVPPGYISHLDFLNGVISRNLRDEHGIDPQSVSAEEFGNAQGDMNYILRSGSRIKAIRSAIDDAVHEIQGRLYQGDLVGCYVGPLADKNILEVEANFWATERGGETIHSGRYYSPGFGINHISGTTKGFDVPLFLRESVEQDEALTDYKEDVHSGAPGRPSTGADAALVYVTLFADGHVSAGLSWKQALEQVNKALKRAGRMHVSLSTLKSHTQTPAES
ncbi:hypothetical protein ACOTTU_21920 [Roseobacter sp. EG26]|uniref:hypothetical protein n=1 Tax=Roseobacter sp. EG26 TaxID=3412477 RepID=UPI003CE44DAF